MYFSQGEKRIKETENKERKFLKKKKKKRFVLIVLSVSRISVWLQHRLNLFS